MNSEFWSSGYAAIFVTLRGVLVFWNWRAMALLEIRAGEWTGYPVIFTNFEGIWYCWWGKKLFGMAGVRLISFFRCAFPFSSKIYRYQTGLWFTVHLSELA